MQINGKSHFACEEAAKRSNMDINESNDGPRQEVDLCHSKAELQCVVNYFHDASDAALQAMGVDRARLPARDEWLRRIFTDVEREPHEQDICYVIWRCDGRAVGHSSMNKIVYGEEGYAHLHLWDGCERRRGLGTAFMRASIDVYIRRYSLKRVISEPFAKNPGPNKLLPKLGFSLVKQYRTTPGAINFEQEVNRWQLTTLAESQYPEGCGVE
jgi:RimJ/RimL family protein N-acetyltransferase